MTDQHEFAGKTIEEALETAAEALTARAGSIEYKLLETPKRFFFMGGSKEYRIRVLKFTPSAGGPPVVKPAPPAEPAPPARAVAEQPVRPAPEKRSEPAAPLEERREVSDEDDEVDRILDLVEEFVDCWGMDLEMEVDTTDERLEINFFGGDQQYLLEKKGAGLLALQLILGKMLYKRGLIRRKLQVDCQEYRQRRENELNEIANRMADQVKKSGEDTYLNPMNPYERRIVHLALVDDPQVTTESLGEGYMKKIRVIRI